MDKEKIEITKQEQPGWCFISCAQAILRFYGEEKSQEELKEIFGTTNERGTDFFQAINGFLRLNYPITFKKEANIHNLAYYLHRGLPTIVDWWHDLDEDEPDGHYSIVESIQIKLNETTINLLDPQIGDIRTFSWQDFEDRWHDVTPKGERIDRGLIVVYPK